VSLNVAVRLAPFTTIPRPSTDCALCINDCAPDACSHLSQCAPENYSIARLTVHRCAPLQLWEPVRAVICACGGNLSACEEAGVRAVDFDLERIARGNIRGMFRAAITAGAGREHREQINLGKEFDEVTGTNRTGFHEVLVSIAREVGAHEDVHHIMHCELGLADVEVARGGKRAGEVGVAAVVVIVATEQPVRVRVATSTDDVVHPGTIGIPAIPPERIMSDGSHRAQVRQSAPEAVAGGKVGGVQRAGLGAEEALREVGGVEQIESPTCGPSILRIRKK
jgi:hypothetical protein